MRVTFRAQFAGPIAKLNPAGFIFKHPTPVTVEIYQQGKVWKARQVDSKVPSELTQIGHAPAHGVMKDLVSQSFAECCSKWELCDADGKRLDPATVEETPEGTFKAKVITHISADSQVGIPGNQFKTPCGLIVPAYQIRSKRGHNPPDCAFCRNHWAKIPREERLPR